MKIIDLYNKISNCEKLPLKIRYDNKIWELDKNLIDYYRHTGTINRWLSIEYGTTRNLGGFLNDEIEIIEDTPKEDKKIEKLDLSDWVEITCSEDCKPENLAKLFNRNACNFSNKINEIIDKVNGE